MIITISGNLGAGKTTLAAQLSKTLGYEEFYIGGLIRGMAAEQKMPIEEFYARLKHNPELERSVDERQAELMREKENLIVQGRIAWFFAKQSPHRSYNIFLAVAPEVGAQRTAQRPEYRDENGKPKAAPDDLIKMNTSRAKLELERYRSLYGIENFLDPAHYDLVLDTTSLAPDKVLEKVLKAV